MANLHIFDFSGTLTLGSLIFGRSDVLQQALQATGVWSLWLARRTAGEASVEEQIAAFWNDVITPTWESGGTTHAGYARLLTERLGQHCDASPVEIHRVISDFAACYWEHLTIHPAWGAYLRRLVAQPEARVVIATDHYAEATNHILRQLTRLGLAGMPVLQAKNSPVASTTSALVANSADLGCLKSTRQFWQAVREALPQPDWSCIHLIDDFGANEAPLDAYSTPEQSAARQHAVEAVLTDVFGCRPQIVSSVLLHTTAPIATLMMEFENLIRQVVNTLAIKTCQV